MGRNIQDEIRKTVTENPIVVYMKGTKDMPMCGFSAAVADAMKKTGADFKDVNVLADPEIRQGIKDYANWPTIPQIYIQGEFIGGCDITLDLAKSGELQKRVDQALGR